MQSIGETLRRERIRRNLDLEKISQELKISVRMLEAIEAEQFDRLPGGVFARSFVRQYAHILGLDEDEMAAEVEQILHPESTADPIYAPQPAGESIPLPRVDSWQSVGSSNRWAFLPSALMMVAVMLLCSLVYVYWQRTRHPALPAVEAHNRTVPAAQAPATPSAPTPAPETVAAVQTAVPAAQPGSAPGVEAAAAKPAAEETGLPAAAVPADLKPATPPTTPPAVETPAAQPAGPVHVEIAATESAWVMARADGKYVFSDTLAANQRRTVDAQQAIVLRLGNAGGVEVWLNGKPIGPLGAKGEVRTIQLTSGGFQAVAPPKPVVPFDPL
jgi:cytoskeleton protein RodZ